MLEVVEVEALTGKRGWHGGGGLLLSFLENRGGKIGIHVELLWEADEGVEFRGRLGVFVSAAVLESLEGRD